MSASLVTLILLSVPAPAPAAKDSGHKIDLVWTHPDYATVGPKSIAFMPAVSWNNDLPSEHTAEDAAANAFKGLAYRWLSPRTVQALLLARPSADSLWKEQRGALLKRARVDSLAAPALCSALHARALLTFFVEELERQDLEWNETGRPSTMVQVRAALVDSTGRLLWSAAGSERGEGQMQDATSGMTRVDASGLSNAPATGTGKSPEPREVFSKLFARWVERFPAPPVAPAAPAAPSTP
jgi:hypothetical protein